MKTARKNFEEEAEAMTIICNIQTMQSVVHGRCFEYGDFNGNSLDELRNLQSEMIRE